MGCSASVALVQKNSLSVGNNKRIFYDRFRHPDINISDEDKNIIKSQWQILSANITGNGIAVFINLFKQYPEIKELFRCEDVEDEYLERNDKLREHAIRFMKAVGTAVESIDDLETSMSKSLLNLGKRHLEFTGFRPVYFEEFYKAISKVWNIVLGSGYTPVSAEAWRQVLVFILEHLKKGYHLASLEVVTAGAIKKVGDVENTIMSQTRTENKVSERRFSAPLEK